MNKTLRITGIAGSLRTGSLSKAVLASVSAQLPTGTEFSTLDIGAIPHYDQDLEASALPDSVAAARAQVAASDAVIIVVPEFNHGIPGVLKNTLDWLSRPAFTSCFAHKPVFFMTLSQGALGGVRAQYQMRETLASMLCELYPLRELTISFAGDKVRDGVLVDEATVDAVRRSLDRFLTAMAKG